MKNLSLRELAKREEERDLAAGGDTAHAVLARVIWKAAEKERRQAEFTAEEEEEEDPAP
jgi:hypothetical protein